MNFPINFFDSYFLGKKFRITFIVGQLSFKRSQTQNKKATLLQSHCCSLNGLEMASKIQKGIIFKIRGVKDKKEDYPPIWKSCINPSRGAWPLLLLRGEVIPNINAFNIITLSVFSFFQNDSKLFSQIVLKSTRERVLNDTIWVAKNTFKIM